MVVSGVILEEYGRVLRREKFKLPLSLIGEILELIRKKSLVVIPHKHFNVIPEDPGDNEFLDVAVEAKAEAIISGDQHLLSRKAFHGVLILSPIEFLTQTGG